MLLCTLCVQHVSRHAAQEVNRVSEVVTSLADPSANVIFGAVIDDQYEGEAGLAVRIVRSSPNHVAVQPRLFASRVWLPQCADFS